MGSFTARENILLASLFRLPMSKAVKWTDELLDMVGLKDRADLLLTDLALADQKALEFARVLATEPEVILLDEVMAGLTPTNIEPIVQLIRKFREKGKTFLLVEHRLEVVVKLCERIIVFNFGKKISEGTPLEVTKNKEVVEAYIGLEDITLA
jgi:branched-chain amino acid transport system ATP-binding protein